MLSSQINQFSIDYTNSLPNQPKSKTNLSLNKMDSSANLLPLDGKLSKYTNVMKGWQNRFFILNPQHGTLDYFVSQAEAVSSQYRPRGSLLLAGAVIAPGTEDSYTFSVNAANGEVYKLRAVNAKERQVWVSRLRTVVQHYSSQIAQEHPPLASASRKPRTRSMVSNVSNSITKIKDQVQQLSGQPNTNNIKYVTKDESGMNPDQISIATSNGKNTGQQSSDSLKGMTNRMTTLDSKRPLQKTDIPQLQEARQALVSIDNYHAGLISMLDSLNFHADHKLDQEADTLSNESEEHLLCIPALDRDVLLIKSTSSAMLQCLSNCYTLLYKFNQQQNLSLPPDAKVRWVGSKQDVKLHHESDHLVADVSSLSSDIALKFEKPRIANPEDEVADCTIDQEEELGAVDEHKNVIMHLLSQLKLGMDLTKVTLPTFILEKRSLLEMYADFLGHCDLLLQIPKGETPQDRMHRALKFYLTSFQSGRQGHAAKKPYNPIVGEVFQCSYYVPKSATSPSQANTSYSQAPPSAQTHSRIQFLAEQVSHHPPVSAFHASCPDHSISLTSHIWTRSKFMNMSVGVVNIGEGTLCLADHQESYVMTYPSAYARSILTVPWSELGGRCSIACQETGLTANVVFHTKPMYGGLPHRVTAEVKDKSGFVSCKVQGKWNGELEFTYFNQTTSNEAPVASGSDLVDTTKLQTFLKYVRPIDAQESLESRKLWQNVTQTLRSGDVTAATEHKTELENQQRAIEHQRQESGLPVPTAYFTQVKGKDYDAYTFKGFE